MTKQEEKYLLLYVCSYIMLKYSNMLIQLKLIFTNYVCVCIVLNLIEFKKE